jgi:hypothetical protein
MKDIDLETIMIINDNEFILKELKILFYQNFMNIRVICA